MTAIHVLPLATADASLEMVGHTESLSPCGVGSVRDHAQSCSRDHRDRGYRGGERFFAPTECDALAVAVRQRHADEIGVVELLDVFYPRL